MKTILHIFPSRKSYIKWNKELREEINRAIDRFNRGRLHGKTESNFMAIADELHIEDIIKKESYNQRHHVYENIKELR